jgi:hypothetical protein
MDEWRTAKKILIYSFNPIRHRTPTVKMEGSTYSHLIVTVDDVWNGNFIY